MVDLLLYGVEKGCLGVVLGGAHLDLFCGLGGYLGWDLCEVLDGVDGNFDLKIIFWVGFWGGGVLGRLRL